LLRIFSDHVIYIKDLFPAIEIDILNCYALPKKCHTTSECRSPKVCGSSLKQGQGEG